MISRVPPSAARGLARLPRGMQWVLLFSLSAALSLALLAIEMPAALLLGPMIVGIATGVNGATIRMPRLPYLGAQALIGCLVASAITPEILGTFAAEWPLFLGVVFATLAASSFLGWLMSRWSALPGTTAIWGSSPGAASAMVLMAEAFGADTRLVAFMQYLRVVCVAGAAALISRFWVDTSGTARPDLVWFPPLPWLPFLETLAIAGVGASLGRLFRMPAAGLLGPMIIGGLLHSTGLVAIELPEWLLAATYAVIGWSIGLGFTRQVLLHASRALPQILLSILALLTFCGGLAFMLARILGIDPLTAYLATSPGGMDSIAVIAASSNVDLSFVMGLQTIRFLVVLLLGPPLARLLAHKTSRKGSLR